MTANNMPTLDDIHSIEADLNDTLYESFDTGYYIGMMSGTSLDGLDAVICQFDASFDAPISTDDSVSDNANNANNANNSYPKNGAKIIATHSAEFPTSLRQVLLALCQPNATTQLTELNSTLTQDYPELKNPPRSELEWFGWASQAYAEFASTVVNQLLEQSAFTADSILAIGCHGQTVRHCPDLKFSLQLVDPNIIAERTGISVVTDFRRRDMAVGGQGAPLAPAFHLAQFAPAFDNSAEDSKHRIVVNLGGIANITVLPANQSEDIIGYDTGPANILLDAWYQKHVESLIISINASTEPQSFEPLYDKGGSWAKSGQLNAKLLEQLLTHPYIALPAPKSTGREDFHLGWLNEQIALVSNNPSQTEANEYLRPEDVQATLTAFSAHTLSKAILNETTRLNLTEGEIIVCGGGAYNGYLLNQIAEQLPNWTVLTSHDFGIAPTWIEAMAFAWLARQTIMGETGNLPAVTGASKGVVLGQVCFA